MVRTHGSQASSKLKTSYLRSLRDQQSRKRGGVGMSSEGTSPASSSPQTVSIGMENTPSPSFSITSPIFGFLKSLDLKSADLNPDMVPLVHLIAGWEIVVYDPVVAESKLRGNEAESVGEWKDYDVRYVNNEFIVEDAGDSDEDEPIFRFKRTVPTKSQTITKLPFKRQRKTTPHPMYLLLHPYHGLKFEVWVLPLCCPCQKTELNVLSIKTNWPINLSKHPPKHPSNQFHPRDMPKNGLPQNKCQNWLKNLMNQRKRKLWRTWHLLWDMSISSRTIPIIYRLQSNILVNNVI